MKYINCRLSIHNDQEIEYEDDIKQHLHSTIRDDPLRIKTIERFNNWVANYGKNCNGEDLIVLGEHLYSLLFDNVDDKKNTTIREAFETAYEWFEDQKKSNPEQRLRLILIFYQEAGKWAPYPWEFIYMPWKPEGFFLAGKKTDLILTRFVPEAGLQTVERAEGPLKILVSYCHPRELDMIVADDILDEINKLKSDDIDILQLENPSVSQLQKQIKEFKPDIFHFIGHGNPGEIAFFKEPQQLEEEEILKGKGRGNQAAWIKDNRVAMLFSEHQPRLVFLHACKGAMPTSLDQFRSTALELVYKNIPVVIAMQYAISNEDALIFASKFYQQIGQGKFIDEAVAEAREALAIFPATRGAWNDRSFGTPVVYMQERHETPIVAPKVKEETDHAKVACPNPDCKGWVAADQARCLKCRHHLMTCPNCKHVMDQDIGLCGYCDYEVSASTAGGARSAAAVPSSDRLGH